jgi:hypothetical protein
MAPYDDMVPHVKRLLAKILIIRGQLEISFYDEAIVLLEDVIQRIGASPEGTMKDCLYSAQSLLQIAQKLRNNPELITK